MICAPAFLSDNKSVHQIKLPSLEETQRAMKLSAVIFFSFLYYSFIVGTGYKILVFSPRFGASHVLFLGRIADTLADAGHNVTVYQPILDRTITKNGSSNPDVKFVFTEYDYEESIVHQAQNTIWKDDTLDKLLVVSFLFSKFIHSQYVL